MANLSLKTTLAAYKELSAMHDDPNAQGATQTVSALRYFFALDKFNTKFNRNCDTRSREDKTKFNEFVGDFCHISESKGMKYYTTNFYLPLKTHNGDYNVGSNFYSAGQVRTSLNNGGIIVDYPIRGSYPLFKIQNGELIYEPSYIQNLSHYIPESKTRIALAIWLCRYGTLNIDKQDLSGANLLIGIREYLLNYYSQDVVSFILGNETDATNILDTYPISYTPKQCVVYEPKNIENLFPEFSSNDSSAKIEPIGKELMPDELKKGFLIYFSNYLRLSTGKCDDEKIDQYLRLYEKTVETPLKEKFTGFNSIFDFDNTTELNNFFFNAKDSIPSMGILLLDKWPKDKEEQTLYYEPWTMIRHYKVFLDMLKDFNQLAISISSKPKAMNKAEIAKVQPVVKDYLRAMRTKPFLLLAGISGTGKSRIVKQMAFDSCPDVDNLQSDETSPGNYCLVEVKPNWHDSSELVGYESKINGDHYVVTPFIKFLIKAKHYPNIPFFLCLDEMNLAPVEQYFAEFLSILESRKKVGNKITSEPLIKPEIFSKYFADFKKEYFRDKLAPGGLVPEQYAELWKGMGDNGLRIPSNLIVIGTVNMDETTHQFSRKVIDRAMTIEMNLPEGEPFMDFFNNARDLEYNDNPTSHELYLPTLVKAADVVAELQADNVEKTEWLKKEVAAILTALNVALNDTPFKIAYRVQNELMLYFHELWLEDKSAEWSDILRESVDQILMMKVLPRVEGDDDLLEKPFENLANFCTPYPNAMAKLAEMKGRLDRAHFTSYWP
ncbi:MAG: hypothetical protein NC548_42785 [Lachnospiraceae bacterium]|nr:hypothetical protein [Lachnospiraceae bacterium]